MTQIINIKFTFCICAIFLSALLPGIIKMSVTVVTGINLKGSEKYNMKFSHVSTTAVTLALIMTIGVSAASAGNGGSSAASAGSAPSSSYDCRNSCHGGTHFGGDFGALKTLSDITGISREELLTKYPQQTPWQIAKQLGKLDAMKKGFLEHQKTFLNRLVSEGRITADDQAKIYADLQKRVSAIDGTKTVTLGRPGYRPEHKG